MTNYVFHFGFSLRSIRVVGVHDRIRSGAQLHGKNIRTVDIYPSVSVQICGFPMGFCRSSAGPNHMHPLRLGKSSERDVKINLKQLKRFKMIQVLRLLTLLKPQNSLKTIKKASKSI